MVVREPSVNAPADYQKTIRVNAGPGALFDALTTESGLSAWWTRATGSGDGGELHFRHRGLTPALDCIEECTRGWDHFLQSLRTYVEMGRGMPLGSEEDNARRR